MPLFTIFTGTYNSESVIHRVFNSIDRQSVKDFEWIVIDDCSQDNTIKLIEEFKNNQQEIEIRFFVHKQNCGVAASRREALEIANGKYFITWDHDDEQASDQLEIYSQLWGTHEDDSIANIFAKMTDQHGKMLGRKFPRDGFISDYITVHNSYLVGNKELGNVVEHHVCVKTNCFREVIEYYDKNAHLLAGNIPNGGDVWGMLAYLGYKTIYTNRTVRTYYISEPGRKSMSDVTRNHNPNRVLMFKLLWVNYFDKLLPFSELKWKLRNIFAVVMYGLMAGKSLRKVTQLTHSKLKKMICVIFYVPAKILAVKYSRQK